MERFSEEHGKDHGMTRGVLTTDEEIENKDCDVGDKEYDNDLVDGNLRWTRSPGLTSFLLMDQFQLSSSFG